MNTPDRPQTISAPRTVAASVAGRDNDGGGILYRFFIRLARLAWGIVR